MVNVLEVADEIVMPAVRSVFEDGEVSAISLRLEGPVHRGSVSLSLTAVGEDFHCLVFQGDVKAQSSEAWREQLRSNLVDFVAESRFGWGQNRDRPGPWPANI